MGGTKGRDGGGLGRSEQRKTEGYGAGPWSVRSFGNALDLTSASCPVLQNFISNCVLGGADSLFCIRRCIWSSNRQQLEPDHGSQQPVVPVVPATKSDGGSLCRQDLERDRGNGNPCVLAVPAHRRRWNPSDQPETGRWYWVGFGGAAGFVF